MIGIWFFWVFLGGGGQNLDELVGWETYVQCPFEHNISVITEVTQDTALHSLYFPLHTTLEFEIQAL